MGISRTSGISKAGLMSLAAVAVLAAGCQSERLGNLDTVSPPPPPPPLRAAPAGNVQQSALPAPGASSFPPAPAGPQGAAPSQPGGTQVANIPPATAPDLTPGKVAGVWSVSVGGQTCKVATPQTKLGQYYHAGPLKCPGELANLKAWSVNGKQLVFYDVSGGTVAQLYSSGEGRFDGQTTNGQAISLSR
ncbi:protease inhibitor Inh/omp19 family protein [Phyllobacterium leguminum]|uniref:Protease inhibitor Inh n=1 Tax=Phyllobacterium leguminum TaxID=314237 RepID=A0A318T771_9HYPH|nr:protease inhibitor Inh/omp19 family protein [Phyllobacterium leguminum]PYE88965.1 protease inhibitor Inh [Phyllobacterium leguminum]